MTHLKNISSPTLPGEKWKRLPFTAKYELSSYGRTRLAGNKTRLITPRLHAKQVAGKKKILLTAQVELSMEGKRKMLTISKWVYALFVKKFDTADRRVVIRYRDNNPHNCDAANLVKMPYDAFVREGFKTGNRKAGNTFVNQSKPVSQYTPDGKFIAVFASAVEASAATGINRRYINQSAWLVKIKAGGYYWRYGKPAKRISP